MTFLAIACAFYLLVRFYDRLRLISWTTAQPLYVALYLTHVLWALGIIYDAFDDGMQWHQWFGMCAQLLWLEVTKHGWLAGVPDAIKTQPADLGDPELGRHP